MYARLDKLREDLQKAIAKRDEAEKSEAAAGETQGRGEPADCE